MRTISILYLGNQLKEKGKNPTCIDTLGEKFKEFAHVRKASPFSNPILKILHMWTSIIRFQKSTDLVLIDTYSTRAFFFAYTSAALCRIVGLKYIPILHGGDLPSRAKRSPKKLAGLLNNAFRVVSPSPYLKNALDKDNILRIKVIPNLLEIDKYPYSIPDFSGGPRLFWLRAFSEIYRPSDAVKLLKYLIAKGYKESILYMVGPEKDQSFSTCVDLAEKLGVKEKVKFTGKLSLDQWIPLARECQFFINTTSVDNMPVSLLEAMALGIPVFSTDVGGIPFMITHKSNGVLFPPGDIEAMGNSIIEYLDNVESLVSISQKGRHKAEECAWENVSIQWRAIFQKV